MRYEPWRKGKGRGNKTGSFDKDFNKSALNQKAKKIGQQKQGRLTPKRAGKRPLSQVNGKQARKRKEEEISASKP